MRKFYYVKKDINKYYNEDIVIGKVSALMNWTYLKYREKIGKPIKEAQGQHLMYIVEDFNNFEKNLRQANIEFVELSITEDEYDEACVTISLGMSNLLEQVEYRGNNYKIIIRSNENTNHCLPHVHVEMFDGSSASITINDDVRIIVNSGKAKNSDYQNAIDYIKQNEQKLRKSWNDFSNSTYKFQYLNGKYI